MSENLVIKAKPKNQTREVLRHRLFLIACIRKKHPIYNTIDLSGHSHDKISEMYNYLVKNAHKELIY